MDLAPLAIIFEASYARAPPGAWLPAQPAAAPAASTPTASALHLQCILQKACTNINKDSGATAITVSTDVAESLPAGRRGLANLRARALAIGRHFDFLHGAAGGTVFTLWLAQAGPLAVTEETYPAHRHGAPQTPT